MSEVIPKGHPLSGVDLVGRSAFEDAVLPLATVSESLVRQNLAALQGFCDRHGASLAPHGKTTMSPELFAMQVEAGSWGITAASLWQAATMRAVGVPRVFIANVVVAPAEIRWLGQAVADGFEIYCYVDSLAGVAIMDEVLGELGTGVPVPVVVEMGFAGGRTGARTQEDGLEVARAVSASEHLALRGTSGFEGIIVGGERPVEVLVKEFLGELVSLTKAIDDEGLFADAPEVILSAGGSAFFDYVVECFAGLELSRPLRRLLRSGAYVTHDDGGLHNVSPMGRQPRTDVESERLVGAVEIWATVLSRPEPDRVILGLGKRDISTDGLLPLAKKVLRRGSQRPEPIEHNRVTAVNDQHAYLTVDESFELGVGDVVGFGISHPCTTFDKWRSMHLVDDEYRVIGAITTEF